MKMINSKKYENIETIVGFFNKGNFVKKYKKITEKRKKEKSTKGIKWYCVLSDVCAW